MSDDIPAAAQPHRIDWQEGTPFSQIYGDRFYSRSGAVEERQLVFLQGNDLPRRFAHCQGHERFVVGETGFGTGLNFLLTAELWLRSAAPSAHLHYLSLEAHPLSAEDLALCQSQWPELAQVSRQLLPHWPLLLRGSNTLRLAQGRITLQLILGDVAELAHYRAMCDAWYLDGFAPDKNPAMWSEPTLQLVAERTRLGGTCATYSAAGHMRRSLERYGFRTERLPGHGGKRHRTVGVRTSAPPLADDTPWYNLPTAHPPQRVLVLGAGLAGSWTARRLADLGCAVTVADPQGIAQGSSGNPAAIVVPQVSADSNPVHGWHAAGYGLTTRLLRDHAHYRACGVMHCAVDASAAEHCQRMLGWWQAPAELVRWADADQTAALTGLALPHGGLWLGTGGVQYGPGLCRALLDHPAITVTDATPSDAVWDATVLATAHVPPSWTAQLRLRVEPARGQIELLPVSPASAVLRSVVSGAGYLVPALAGRHVLGASYVRERTDTQFSPDERRENLARADALTGLELAPATDSRVALRATTADHLPYVGAVPQWDDYMSLYGDLARGRAPASYPPAPYQQGLWLTLAHGSRGAVSAPLAAELLASQMLGLPSPVTQTLEHAVHPGRMAIRAWRSGRSYAP